MKYYEVRFSLHDKNGDSPSLSSEGHMLTDDACDVLTDMAGEAGFEAFEKDGENVVGYVQTTLFDQRQLDELLSDFPFSEVTVTYDVKEAEYKDWNEEWENEGFAPIDIDGRCVIHDGRHLPEHAAPLQVEIDAKMSFGTGNHETTRMIIRHLLDISLDGCRFLDCGCGTGILGIVALKSGARKAFGYDIDEWSADNARHNAVINGVGDSYEVALGDASVLDDDSRKAVFDVVVANINRNILLADMPRFREAMAPRALLILSGFYADDVSTLTEKALSLGLHPVDEDHDGDWTCLVFRS